MASFAESVRLSRQKEDEEEKKRKKREGAKASSSSAPSWGKAVDTVSTKKASNNVGNSTAQDLYNKYSKENDAASVLNEAYKNAGNYDLKAAIDDYNNTPNLGKFGDTVSNWLGTTTDSTRKRNEIASRTGMSTEAVDLLAKYQKNYNDGIRDYDNSSTYTRAADTKKIQNKLDNGYMLSNSDKLTYAQSKLDELTGDNKKLIDSYMQSRVYERTTTPGQRAYENKYESSDSIKKTLKEQSGWDKDTFNKYIKYADRITNYDITNKNNEQWTINDDDSKLTKLGKTLKNDISEIVMSPVSNVAAMGSLLDRKDGLGADTYDRFSTVANATQYGQNQINEQLSNYQPKTWLGNKINDTTQNIAGQNTAQLLHGAGVSAIESYYDALLGAATGSEVLSYLPFAASGFMGEYNDADGRNLTESQALLEGLVGGVAEVLTEKVSLDSLWGTMEGTKMGRNIIANLLVQAGIEGSEELASDIINEIGDLAITSGGGTSKYEAMVDEAVASGASLEEAKQLAWKQTVQQAVGDTIAGAISGGMSGTMAARQGYRNAEDIRQQAEDIRNNYTEAAKNATDEETRKKYESYAANPYTRMAEQMDDSTEMGARRKAAVEKIAEDYGEKGKTSKSDRNYVSQSIEVSSYIRDKQNQSRANAQEYTRLSVPKEYREDKSNISENEARMSLSRAAKKGDTDTMISIYHQMKNSTDQNVSSRADDIYSDYTAYASSKGADSEAMQAGKISNQDAYLAGIRGEDLKVTGTAEEAYKAGQIKLKEAKMKSTVSAKSDIKDATAQMSDGSLIKLSGTFDGDGKVEMSDGNTISLSELTLNDSAVSRAYVYADNQDTVLAKNAYLNNINDETNIDTYNAAWGRVFSAAQANVDMDTVMNNNKQYAEMLGTDTLKAMYEAGVKQKEFQQNIEASKAVAKELNVTKGTGTFEDARVNANTKIDTTLMSMAAKVTGLNVVLTDAAGSGVGTNQASFRISNSTITVTEDHVAQFFHELGEFAEFYASDEFNKVQNAAMNAAYNKMGSLAFKRTLENYHKTYKLHDANQTVEESSKEMTNDYLVALMATEDGQKAISDYLVKNYGAEEAKTIGDKLKEMFAKLIDSIRNMVSNSTLSSYQKKAMETKLDKDMEAIDAFINALDKAIENYQSAEENKHLVLEGETTRASLETFQDGGRDTLAEYLDKESGLTKKDQDDILETLDYYADYVRELMKNKELDSFTRWSKTGLIKNAAGVPMLKVLNAKGTGTQSVIVSNGEYPLNIDFTQVCKKRIALNSVLNRLVSDYGLNLPTLTESMINQINTSIKSHGFEIACGLCFVDAKRYRVGGWAESFADGEVYKKGKKAGKLKKKGWNQLVQSMIPKGSDIEASWFNYDTNHPTPIGRELSTLSNEELDMKGLKSAMGKWAKWDGDQIVSFGSVTTNGKSSSPNEVAKMAYLLYTDPSQRKMIDKNDIIASEGLDALRVDNGSLYQLINNHWGSGKPKLPHGFTAYGNDVLESRKWGAKNDFNAKSAAEVGGIRVQSFSDYVANMFFDYMQMFADLSARELTGHSYTKEVAYARIFGMTGMKINMSLVPMAAKLTKAQQERYTSLYNKGGVKAILADEEFKALAEHAGLDENGNYIWEDETFPFDEAMKIRSDSRYADNVGTIAVGVSDAHIEKLLNDPTIDMVIPYHSSGVSQLIKKARNLALYTDYTNQQTTKGRDGKNLKHNQDFDWYADLAKTNDAKASAENYKAWCKKNGYTPVFPQFTSNENYYKLLEDFRSYNGDAYVGQQAIKMNFPAEVKELILNSLKEQQETETKMEYELSDDQNTLLSECKEILGINDTKHSLEIDSDGIRLSKEQNEYFKDSKARDENGRLLKLYHGTASAGFNIFKKGEKGGSWFTTSFNDADSYGGYSGKKYVPEEQNTTEKVTSGQYTLGNYFAFDTEADKKTFEDKHPNYKEYKIEREIEKLRRETEEKVSDLEWDDNYEEAEKVQEEFERIETLSKEIRKDYFAYEKTRMSDIPIKDIAQNPSKYSLYDLKRAGLELDREFNFDDEYEYNTDEEFKQVLADSIKAHMEEYDDVDWDEVTVRARLAKGSEGEVTAYTNRRVYEVYANVTNPVYLDAQGYDISYKLGYKAVENALADESHDGVIIKNASQGAYGEPATIVITKEPNQVKLTSNDDPTDAADIRYALDSIEDDFFFDNENLDAVRDAERSETREATEILAKGMEALKHVEVDQKAINELATKIRRDTGSSIKHSVLADNLSKVFAYMQSEDYVDYADMLGILKDVAKPIIDQSTTLAGEDAYKSFIDKVKNYSIKLTDTQKEEVINTFGSYGKFRSAMMPLNISEKGTVTLEQVWQELSEASGYVLDYDATEGEMPTMLYDTLNSMRPTLVNNYEGNLEEVANDLALNIVGEYFRLAGREEASVDIRKLEKKIQNRIKKEYDDRLKQLNKEAKYNAVWRDAEARMEANKLKAKVKKDASEARERQNARDNKKQIKQLANKLVTWIDKPTEQHHVLKGMVEPILDLLYAIDFVDPLVKEDKNGYYVNVYTGHKENGDLKPERINGQTKDEVVQKYHEAINKGIGMVGARHWQERMQTIANLYNQAKTLTTDDSADWNIVHALDSDLADAFTDLIARNRNKISVNQLSADDLKILKNVVSNVVTAVNQGNKAWTINAETSELSYSTIETANDFGTTRRLLGLVQKGKEMLTLDMFTPVTYTNLAGDGAKKIYKSLRNGFNQKVRDLKTAEEFMSELLGKKNDAKKWANTIHEFTLSNGTMRMSETQIMGLYETLKRTGAIERAAGGIIPSEIKRDGKFDIPQSDKAFHLTLEDMAIIFEVLSDDQKMVADAMQKYMAEKCAKDGNEVSLKLYGYEKFLDPTYYPYSVDKTLIATTERNAMTASPTAIERAGFTKNLVKNTKPLVIDDIFDTFTRHVVQMANYHGLAAANKDALRWLNYIDYNLKDENGNPEYTNATKKALDKIFGSDRGSKYFTQLLMDLNGEMNTTQVADFIGKISGNIKASQVLGNVRVIAQQPTAIARAMAVIDPKYLFVNPATAIANIKKGKELSDIFWWKSKGYYETSIGQSMKEIVTGQGSASDKAKEVLGAGAGAADDITWGFLYTAVEREVRAKNKGKGLTEEEYRAKVNERFDEVIDMTQVVDSTIHRSQYMRSTDGIHKLQTAFMAEPTKSYNMLINAALEDMRTDSAIPKNFMRAATAFTITSILNAVAQSVVDAFRYDTDDDRWDEVFTEKLKENFADNLNPLKLIPWVKDIFDYTYNKFTGQYTSGNTRYDLDSIEGFVDAAYQVTKFSEGNYTAYGKYMILVKPISQLTGIPLYAVSRDVTALHNSVAEDWTKKNPTASDYKNSIFNATERGYSAEELTAEIDDAQEFGMSVRDIQNSVSSKYKSSYYDLVQAGDMVEAEKLADQAMTILQATGMTAEDAEKEINSWLEESIGYKNLDNAIKSGVGITEAIKEVLQEKEADKVTEHVMNYFGSSVEYERKNGSADTQWEMNVEKALKAIDGTNTYDAVKQDLAEKEAERQAKSEQREANAQAKEVLFQAIDTGTDPIQAVENAVNVGMEYKAIKSATTSQYKEEYISLVEAGNYNKANLLQQAIATTRAYCDAQSGLKIPKKYGNDYYSYEIDQIQKWLKKKDEDEEDEE